MSQYIDEKICILTLLYTEGGTHMLRHTGMCLPNGLLFHQRSLDVGPVLIKKSLENGSISQKLQKKKKG